MIRLHLQESLHQLARAVQAEQLVDSGNRDAIYRIVETFDKACIGWEDAGLLTFFQTSVSDILSFADKERVVPIVD